MSARPQAQSFALVGWLVRRPRWQRIVGAVVLVLLATWSVLQAVAGIVLDPWWFDTVTAADVWSTIVGAQVLLALAAILVSAAVLGSSVWLPLTGYDDPDPEVSSMVDRYRVRMGPAHRWLMIGFAVFLVLRIGLAAMDQWQVWLLYRHGDSLSRPVPEVGGDLGFYLFRLPFLTVVSAWLRQLVLAGLGLAAFGYAFAGHLHLPVSGRSSNRRAVTHLAVLGAVFAVLQALDYVLVRRPAYAVGDRGAFHGPGYTDVTVGIPATWLLAVVAFVGRGHSRARRPPREVASRPGRPGGVGAPASAGGDRRAGSGGTFRGPTRRGGPRVTPYRPQPRRHPGRLRTGDGGHDDRSGRRRPHRATG